MCQELCAFLWDWNKELQPYWLLNHLKYFMFNKRIFPHLSVRALLWLSLAACRSLSRRFFSDSSFSASLGSRRWRGLTYCSSFSSSSFSLMRMRRSRSGSSSPGHASLSSLAICTSMVAILWDRGGRRGACAERNVEQKRRMKSKQREKKEKLINYSLLSV